MTIKKESRGHRLPEPLEAEPLAPAPKELIKVPSSSMQIGNRGVLLQSFEELLRFARLAAENQCVPKGMTYGAAALCIQAGMERGLAPLAGLYQIVPINGHLSWRGQAAVALILNSGKCKPGTFFMGCTGKSKEMVGWAEAHRVGYQKTSRREFTYENARTAGLIGKQGPWSQYPERQFQWRAVGFLARDVFPDVMMNMPLAEEAADFEPVSLPGPERDNVVEVVTSPEKVDITTRAPDPMLVKLGVVEPPQQDKKEPAEEPSQQKQQDADAPFESHAEADAELAQKDGNLFE